MMPATEAGAEEGEVSGGDEGYGGRAGRGGRRLPWEDDVTEDHGFDGRDGSDVPTRLEDDDGEYYYNDDVGDDGHHRRGGGGGGDAMYGAHDTTPSTTPARLGGVTDRRSLGSPSMRSPGVQAVTHEAWVGLMARLREAGFAPPQLVPASSFAAAGVDSLIPDAVPLRDVMTEVLTQYVRRGEIIEELVQGGSGGSNGSAREGEDRQRKDREIETLRARLVKTEKTLAAAQDRIAEHADDSRVSRRVGEGEAVRLERENRGLLQQLRHSENRAKSKEAEIERLQRRLAEAAETERKAEHKHLEVFRRTQGRAARRGARSDGQMMDVIRVRGISI
jgi:hypothetical protein